MNRFSFLFVVFAIALSAPAFSQTRDENWTQCRDENAAVSLKGCNDVLNSGTEGPKGRFAALTNRGIAYRDLGLNAKAIADFTEAIALNGADVDVLMERGATYGQDGNFEKAIHDYGQALDLDGGENAPAMFARGVFKRLSGDISGGNEDIAAAERIAPNIASIMEARGITDHNFQKPEVEAEPAGGPPPGTWTPQAPLPPATEISTGYVFAFLFGALVLVLVAFLFLRPRKPGQAQTDAPVGLRKRPAVLTALATGHLIGTALGLMSVFGFVGYVRETEKLQTPIVLLVVVALLGLCLLSFVCGIGLLRLRPYGRFIQLGFAWAGLLVIPVGTIISILILRYLKKSEIKALFDGSAPGDETPPMEIPQRSVLATGGFRTAAIIAGIAALLLIGVIVGRQTAASSNELDQSQFAFGVLSVTGRDVEDPYLTESDISNISVMTDETQRGSLSITFTSSGALKMRKLTSNNIGRDIVFVIDGAPDTTHLTRIESTVGENAQLSFASITDAQAYAAKLKASRDPGARYR